MPECPAQFHFHVDQRGVVKVPHAGPTWGGPDFAHIGTGPEAYKALSDRLHIQYRKENPMTRQPEVGDTVLYNTRGSADGRFASQPVPAKVTEVIDPHKMLVSLFVMNPKGIFFDTEIEYSEEGKGGTWSYRPSDLKKFEAPIAGIGFDTQINVRLSELDKAWLIDRYGSITNAIRRLVTDARQEDMG